MIIQSVAGLLIFTGLAWLMSENRKEAKFKIAVIGIVLQLLVGLLLLKLPVFREFSQQYDPRCYGTHPDGLHYQCAGSSYDLQAYGTGNR